MTSQPDAIQTTSPRTNKELYRLLYRGSLSLPDSDLVLEGIAFTAHLSPLSPTVLLHSPIALALESMRGRPSLRFISVVKLAEVHYESVGAINMYIHPRSTIARTFFENVFCADIIGKSGRTDSAIRIGLGDGHGPEETDVLVFGELVPSNLPDTSSRKLRLSVASIIPPPTATTASRKPRPDDPTPRRPPAGFGLNCYERKKDPPLKRRRTESMDSFDEVFGHEGGPSTKREKTGDTPPIGLIDLKTLMAAKLPLPAVPGRISISSGSAKGKGKAHSIDLHEDDMFKIPKQSQANEMELTNKTMVKKIAMKALISRGMPKKHPEFKELFGWVTRGAQFAMRRKIKSVKLNGEEAERLVDMHVKMYFDGFGGLAE